MIKPREIRWAGLTVTLMEMRSAYRTCERKRLLEGFRGIRKYDVKGYFRVML